MTDARTRNTPPRVNLSAREWKLFLIGGLGVAYAASLGVVATRVQPTATQPAGSVPTTQIASGNAVVWFDQLPVSQRPSVAPPRGWSIVGSASQPPVDQGSVANVGTASIAPPSAGRAPRILTRTS